ncbi:hypothetical protein LOK49_LG15G02411 [Camellia lanceoleosa]|uniref:Uncharacterized protein n=1 Tax=Camellia lanceoleosa TaxID=1840588 RepID=A0ACC0F6H2_9ERIC|nr:hypothetical protein LOK49_LG15G02411 [Camellia lanceoleosa]
MPIEEFSTKPKWLLLKLLKSGPIPQIQTLSFVNEIRLDEEDVEEQSPTNPVHLQFAAVLARFAPMLALLSLSLCTLFLYFGRDDIPTSENLLLALIFIAIALFFAGKSKGLIHQSFLILSKQLGSRRTTTNGNGDFYEGEFHKGRCNGSEVYNYFVNGRYERDWVDERYDGYGIESWARGSRFRGQYRQGRRHGYGVYRFYIEDAYAREWCNGQSHGVGMQSCSDGSSYVGEFKCGVKHGLGSYHFR